jgi:hypothetical protein
MGNANVHAGANRLKHSLRNLLDKWEDARAVWNDEVRRDFEDRQIHPLETAINASLNGMQELAEVLSRVRADCSDRDR